MKNLKVTMPLYLSANWDSISQNRSTFSKVFEDIEVYCGDDYLAVADIYINVDYLTEKGDYYTPSSSSIKVLDKEINNLVLFGGEDYSQELEMTKEEQEELTKEILNNLTITL